MAEEGKDAPPQDLTDGDHTENITASEKTTSPVQDIISDGEAEQPEGHVKDTASNTETDHVIASDSASSQAEESRPTKEADEKKNENDEETMASPADDSSASLNCSVTDMSSSLSEAGSRSHGESCSKENSEKSPEIETLGAESLASSAKDGSKSEEQDQQAEGSKASHDRTPEPDQDGGHDEEVTTPEEITSLADTDQKEEEAERPKADVLKTDLDRESDVDDDQGRKDKHFKALIDSTPCVAVGRTRHLIVVGIGIAIVAILMQQFQPESLPQETPPEIIDLFLKGMDKVQAQFPHQRAELWTRSRIHLLKHLQSAQPTEPVSIILTAGLKAKETLRCLAQGLSSAFSSAQNASVLFIDGHSKAGMNSDQVKLEIDTVLKRAFEGNSPAAIIHRFEELPPGSTLIFYRYCDHENAAYKKPFLVFTVLLGDKREIPVDVPFSAVEEMVDDHLQKKFLSHGRPVSYDSMDRDKYGGLWSRISHLILPVAAEERMEREGCGRR